MFLGIDNMFPHRINAGRLSPRVFRLVFGAFSQARYIPPFYRTPSMWLRLTRPGLWRRTGHRPWWLLRLYQQSCVGGCFRGQPKGRPAWLVMLTAPRWARMFGRRLVYHRQIPLAAPAPTGPFPQPRQQPRRRQRAA
jgi:hypothetical protein